MTNHDEPPTRYGIKRMRPRDPAETFRASSPLELFFDLVFVVAVSLSSAQLHHAETGPHLWPAIATYLMVFFAIWWAWVNFTWFASAFDVDDWPYRLLTLTQMAGVIVLAVGTGPAMTDRDFRLVILGYVIMRLALVTQWLRASRSHPDLRRTALRYATGVVVVQLCWVAFPAAPAPWVLPVFGVLVLAELAVPVWAESAGATPWHPEHISDRYGSFTLIVLGESVLASTTAVADALGGAERPWEIATIGLAAFVLAAGMWWLYFAADASHRLHELRTSLQFGYGHYFVFAAAGAYSAGIAVLVARAGGETHLPAVAAAATLTVPLAVFVLGVWALILRHRASARTGAAVVVGAVAVAACALLPQPAASAAVVMAAIVAVVEAGRTRAVAHESHG